MHHFGNMRRLNAQIACRNTEQNPSEIFRTRVRKNSKTAKNPVFKGLRNQNRPF